MNAQNNSTKNNRIIFCLGLALILFLVALRNLFGFASWPIVLILIVVSALSIFCDKDELIALAITFIPLATAFQYKYAILICMVVYLLKFGNSIRISWVIIPLLLMIVWEFLHAIGQSFSIMESFRGFTELIFVTFLLMSNLKDLNYKLIVRTLAITSIIILTIKLLNLLIESGFDFVAIFEGKYRFGKSDSDSKAYSLSFNANQLGFICNLSIIGLLHLILQKENNKLDYLWVTLLVLFGLMTMSRTFIICFLIIMIMFLFSGKEQITKKIKKFLIIVGSLIVLFLLAKWLMPTVMERIFERFTEAEDITSGRGDLFVFYNKHLLLDVKYSLFGIGLQDIFAKLTAIYGCYINVPHNGLQELLVVWGLPGLLLLIVFIVGIIQTAKEKNELSLASFMPLILILISVQAGQLMTSGTVLLSFALSFLSLISVKRR